TLRYVSFERETTSFILFIGLFSRSIDSSRLFSLRTERSSTCVFFPTSLTNVLTSLKGSKSAIGLLEKSSLARFTNRVIGTKLSMLPLSRLSSVAVTVWVRVSIPGESLLMAALFFFRAFFHSGESPAHQLSRSLTWWISKTSDLFRTKLSAAKGVSSVSSAEIFFRL